MSLVTQGYGHEAVVSQGYGHFFFGFVETIFLFVTKVPALQTFEDYVERNLDTDEVASSVLNTTQFQWQPKFAGLVFGILLKS